MENNEIIEQISKYDTQLKDTDPELAEILDNFIVNDLKEEYEKITFTERMLLILSTLIANQSHKLYEKILAEAIVSGLDPIKVKEMLYQSIVYLGIGKMYEFIDITNNVFDEKGVTLPLPGQSTVTQKTRKQEGYKIQQQHYGKEWMENQIQSTNENQRRLWDYISEFGFGDFYARGGLDDKQREIITIAILISMRGCEPQLEIHLRGCKSVGFSNDQIIAMIMILIPYIGFPRIHNVLAVLNKLE